MSSNSQSIQVIDRATQLLEGIARYPESATLKKLCADTELTSSTAHRILASLVENKLVKRSPKGYYRLGERFLQLASQPEDNHLRSVALPIMKAMRSKLAETVNLTVREGDTVVYIEKVTPNRMMLVQQLVGSQAPLHVTAVGKLILGEEGIEGINAYVKRTNLPSYTCNTLSTYGQLLRACDEAKEKGYAFDDEEAEIGVGCIGVLIRDRSGHAIAGLSVSAPISRRQPEWVDDLIEAGEAISYELGYRGQKPAKTD